MRQRVLTLVLLHAAAWQPCAAPPPQRSRPHAPARATEPTRRSLQAEPVCAALQQRLGLDDAELQELMIAWPALVGYSYAEAIAPTLASLQHHLSLDDAELKQIVLRRPELLGYEASHLEPFLAIPGMSAAEVKALLLKRPSVIGRADEAADEAAGEAAAAPSHLGDEWGVPLKKPQLSEVQSLFDDWAQSGRAEQMERGHAENARRAFSRLRVASGQRYLDVGCGNGYSVRWAASVDDSVQAVGVDASEGMVNHARAISAEFKNARFIHSSFPFPEFFDASFDAIFSMEVLYYLEDATEALRQVHRLLKPGGLFVSTIDFYAENTASHSWPTDVGLFMNLLSADGWKAAFESAGFEVLEQLQLKHELKPGEDRTWEHDVGSLMTLGRRAE